MLGTLIKKQLMEIFKGYFYNAKNNKPRSKGGVIAMFILFAVAVFGFLGGMSAMLAISLCGSFLAAGMDWFYFALMSGAAILLGAFGSIFSTYSGLYLSKDNDLLLSMPIPLRHIIASRLFGVYIMGAVYSLTVMIPTCVIYCLFASLYGPITAKIICCIIFTAVITIIVFILSCLLGWVVAKISLKIRNKSFVSVLISIAFIAIYYVVYFRAYELITELVTNVAIYGEKIKGAAYAVVFFGDAAAGNWLNAVILLAAALALLMVICLIISRSFLSIATASGVSKREKYVEKKARERSAFSALVRKEFKRLTSSANYMLNCGMGVLFLLAVSVVMLIKGRDLADAAGELLGKDSSLFVVLLFAALCMLTSMNDSAAPSVSLEGKSIWIPQSLPVHPKYVLRAKASVQMVITAIPLLIASLCIIAAVGTSPLNALLLIIAPQIYTVFMSLFGTVLAIMLPNLTWTNEIVPIKQSGAVFIALLGNWIAAIILGGVYFLFFLDVPAAIYIAACCVVLAAAAFLLLRWIDNKGAKRFAGL